MTAQELEKEYRDWHYHASAGHRDVRFARFVVDVVIPRERAAMRSESREEAYDQGFYAGITTEV